MTEQRKKIKCLAYYDTLDSKDRRYNNPAAYTKFSYVLECLQRLGYNVEILSASYGLDKKYIKGTTRKLSEKATLTTIGSLGRGNKLRNMLSNACFSLKLWFAVNALVKNGDTLLVYHSLGYLDKVKKLKKRKNIRLLLEVEEIYGYVVNSEKAIAKENE